MFKFLLLLSLSFTAFANDFDHMFHCNQLEAQFISQVSYTQPIENEPYACMMKIRINLSEPNQVYTPAGECGLNIEQVFYGMVYASPCYYKSGDKISGVIIKRDGKLILDN